LLTVRPSRGADHFVIGVAIWLTYAQEVVDEVVVLRADFLNGDDLKWMIDASVAADVWLQRLSLEHLDVERGDANSGPPVMGVGGNVAMTGVVGWLP
jgi:hypothetical protein